MKYRSVIAAAGKKFRTKNISQRVKKIVISPIKEMSILADQLEEKIGLNKIISFGQGIPYLDTPQYIKKGIIQSIKKVDTSKYTLEPGITELRKLIAKNLESSKKIKNIKPKKEIMVTVGCQEAMACALASTIDEGDEILLPSPTYASEIEQILQFGGVPKFVPLIEKNGWHLNIKNFEKARTSKTKVVILCNPSNPTGAVFNRQEIQELANFVKKYDLILIADETYDFLLYDDAKLFSPASVKNIRDRVILCGSFSKKYRMTGYRVGYAFADEGIIDHMLKVHDALAICSPAISQKAVIYALKNQKESKKSTVELVKQMDKNRNLMCQELDKLKEFFEYQKPAGAYYIMAKVKGAKINSFDMALKILNEAKVIVIPGAAFGPQGEGYLRFSFAGNPKNIKTGFKRLNKWLNYWKKNNFKL
ncbi:MAG: pyridoxal phosphate-dependent aminotransferase [Patescibacteria group bacterium]|nr:pyridoxal phosphate-dependent aminotransferase [Patescibacteria group bacterium]MDD5164188.1 pyridoxal phosphate-dependent aminotransferase [Patescibacteria group bacterium]MDD5534478.1 pyridoxal phosphate-dependent aminotransferase [Patescibacteria group bacterium]